MATRSKTLSQCEAAWKAGIPLKYTADGFPIVMKPSMQCEIRVKGTQEIAFVGYPQDIEKPELLENIRNFLLSVPRLTAEQFEEADDGIYTWILASVGGSEPTFYASRTTTMLELGTVHYSIATAVEATTVHGAGEVWKHGDEFTFNFLSGTFMDKWPLPPECPLTTMQEYLKQKLKTIFAYLFRSKSLKFRERDTTFVNTRFLELTKEELQGYVKAGFVVCLHDKANKAECKSTKSACEKPMPLEQEMKGGFLTPRKARMAKVPYVSPSLPQFEEARRMLTFGELARPAPTALPAVPTSSLKGMGVRKRKTKKVKAHRRKTRRRLRGGVDDENPDWTALDPQHVGVRMANRLLEEPPPAVPPPRSPTQLMFDRIDRELALTPAQNDYMVQTYREALQRGVAISEEKLRLHMQQRKRTHPR